MSDTPTTVPEPGSLGPAGRPSRRMAGARVSKVLLVWNRIAPFFVSAALFLSGFFAVFAPLPFLILGVTGHWGWLLAALVSNASVVYWTSGPTVFQFYLLAIGSIGLVLPFLLMRRLRPEQVIARTWVVQWCIVSAVIGVYAILRGVTPWQEVQHIFASFFDLLLASLSPEAREQLIANFGGGEVGVAEWRRRTLSELPGTLGILCLLVAWFNLRILINLNPGRFLSRVGLERKVLNRWKNPEWLVWPTLAAWAVVLFTEGTPSDIALNCFKVLMAAYGLQGLAVMGFLFDVWKIRGLFRMLIYMMILVLMIPLLLSIGFFDQWFDFRSKFRQT